MIAPDVRRSIQEYLKTDVVGNESLLSLGVSHYPLPSPDLAIFSQFRLPQNVIPPWINVEAAISNVNADAKNRLGWSEMFDVTVIDRLDEFTPPARIDRIAKRVSTLLHRCENKLEIIDRAVIRVTAGGPIGLEADPDMICRTITVEVFQQFK